MYWHIYWFIDFSIGMHVHFEWPMCEVKKVHVCAVYNDINDITSTQSSFDIVQIYSPNEKSLRECH